MSEQKKSYSKSILFSIQKCKDCGGEIFLAKITCKAGDKWGPLNIKPLTKDECKEGNWYVSIEGSWTSKFTRNSVYFERHSCQQGETLRQLKAPVQKEAIKGLVSDSDDFDSDDLPF